MKTTSKIIICTLVGTMLLLIVGTIIFSFDRKPIEWHNYTHDETYIPEVTIESYNDTTIIEETTLTRINNVRIEDIDEFTSVTIYVDDIEDLNVGIDSLCSTQKSKIINICTGDKNIKIKVCER